MAYTPYYPGGWKDFPNTTTPIVAAALQNMETGIGAGIALDGTATDIQPLGTQAAGATGKAADAGHVHPPTGVATIDATATDIQPVGTQAAGAVGKAADAGHVHATQSWIPADNGLLLAIADPAATASATFTLIAGTIFLTRMVARSPMTISKVWVMGSGGLATGASSGTFAGLYNGSGTLLTGSSDVASALYGATGPQSASFTSAQAVAAGTVLLVALVVNFATTQPTLVTVASGSATRINAGLTSPGAVLRSSVNGTGQTSLPGSITPSANTQANASPIWVGLS